MCFSSPSMPAPPPVPAEPPPAPKKLDAGVQNARREQSEALRRQTGYAGTIATSSLGAVDTAKTSKATLLGQTA